MSFTHALLARASWGDVGTATPSAIIITFTVNLLVVICGLGEFYSFDYLLRNVFHAVFNCKPQCFNAALCLSAVRSSHDIHINKLGVFDQNILSKYGLRARKFFSHP